jgi:MFS transporter, DHA1 family, multidrug resistance protein
MNSGTFVLWEGMRPPNHSAPLAPTCREHYIDTPASIRWKNRQKRLFPFVSTFMTSRQRTVLILVVGSLTAVGPFSIDMYLPGFPAIARDLQTDIAQVTLSLTSYFIGISLGQLGYGPLVDRFGRKKPVIAGLLLYIAAALGCGLAPGINWLIALRFFLALGSCVGIVAARAVVRDLFPVRDMAKVFSTLMLVLAVSPLFAPSVGAFVAQTYGWRYIFVVLAAIGALILFLVIRWLPESRPPDASVSLQPANMTRTYVRILREPTFLLYGLASAAASMGLFAYISDSPVVFMNVLGFSEEGYGVVFGLSALGVIGASQLNRVWLKTRHSREVAYTAAILQGCVALCLVGVSLLHPTAPFVIGMIVLFLGGAGTLSPNTTAVAIEPFASHAGSASALLGSMQMVGGAIGSALVSWFHTGTSTPLAGVMLASTLISFGLQFSFRRMHRRRGEVAAP